MKVQGAAESVAHVPDRVNLHVHKAGLRRSKPVQERQKQKLQCLTLYIIPPSRVDRSKKINDQRAKLALT